jgi:hypothetical protein
MKTVLTIALLLTQFAFLSAQTIAKDDTNNGQMKRMVFEKWDDWSGYNKLVALIYWNIIHKKYKNGSDLRPYKLGGQFEENYAALTLQEINDRKIRDTAEQTMKTHVATYTSMAGGALDLPYALYFKNKFDALTIEVTQVIEQQVKIHDPAAYQLIQTSTDYENYLELLVVEKDRIEQIHQALLDKGERIHAYIDIQTLLAATNKNIENKLMAIAALAKIPTVQQLESSPSPKIIAARVHYSDATAINQMLKTWNF